MDLTKEELKKMYFSMTNVELCQKLGISKVTLVKYIKDAGITPKGKGGGLGAKKLNIKG